MDFVVGEAAKLRTRYPDWYWQILLDDIPAPEMDSVDPILINPGY